MDNLQAIEKRISRRAYLDAPLPEGTARELETLVAECNQRSGLRIALLRDAGEAFRGMRRSYGLFTGVRACFAMAGNCADMCLKEKIGYYGELLILESVRRGLGTCWVGGTFDKNACPCPLAADEALECVITVGLCPEESGFRERTIYRLARRSTKPLERMYQAAGEPPTWFLDGARAVQKAPSALNKQPVLLRWTDGTATIEVPDYGSLQGVDLGIAKLHFELAAGGGQWKLGNGAAYCR